VVVPTTPPPIRLDIALASLRKLVSLKPESLFYSHFGKASDAVEKLQTYVRQLKLWAEIAKEGIDKKEKLDIIANNIVKRDVALQKALKDVQVHPVLGETVLSNSVRGIVDFVEKFGGISE